MGMSNESYTQDNIKEIPFIELFANFREAFSRANELEKAVNEAYFNDDVGLAFVYAATLGVVQIKVQIMEREVERRDEEEGPLSPEETAEVQSVILNEMLQSLFTD